MKDGVKKIILWSITVIISSGLLFWWVKNAQKKLGSFRGEEFVKRLNFPKIEMPDINSQEEELASQVNELKEIIKNAEKKSTTTTE